MKNFQFKSRYIVGTHFDLVSEKAQAVAATNIDGRRKHKRRLLRSVIHSKIL